MAHSDWRSLHNGYSPQQNRTSLLPSPQSWSVPATASPLRHGVSMYSVSCLSIPAWHKIPVQFQPCERSTSNRKMKPPQNRRALRTRRKHPLAPRNDFLNHLSSHTHVQDQLSYAKVALQKMISLRWPKTRGR